MLVGESTDDILGITEEDQRQVFGRNIFNAKNLTFQPSTNIATPANYTIGPADMVTINIWGASQQTIEAEVSSDGYIVIEGVGPVKLPITEPIWRCILRGRYSLISVIQHGNGFHCFVITQDWCC